MIMVPAENFSKQQHHHHNSSYGGGYVGGYSESVGLMNRIHQYNNEAACLGSDLVVVTNCNNNYPIMADRDESRTNSFTDAAASASAASSSKDNHTTNNNNNNHDQEEERDEGWLQLRIGSHTHTHTTSHNIKHDHHRMVLDQAGSRTAGGRLIELDLLPGGSSSSTSLQQHHQQQQTSMRPMFAHPTFHHVPEFRAPPPPPVMSNSFSSTSLFFQQQQQGSSSSTFPHQHQQQQQQQEINWQFRPIINQQNINALASSSSSLMPFGSYFTRPFQVHSGLDVINAGPSSGFRVIDPPRRPHSGIWLMLLASQNQAKEPCLPQIQKSYLRIKDGRMTVRLLIKYLVNKLRLDSESEIEITCRGQQLLPFLTLQHVRDNIWSSRDAVTLLPESSSSSSASDHVMVLHYARTTTTTTNISTTGAA